MNLQFIEKDMGSVATLGNYKIFKADNGSQGFYYKDYDAFKSGNGVCYISEYGFDEKDDMFWQHDAMNTLDQDVCLVLDTTKDAIKDYSGKYKDSPFNTRESIIRDCANALKNNGIKYTKQQLLDFAFEVFDMCDWQSPSTLADELSENMEVC